jgi:DNA-binding CsgD family transcriptional regulator
MNDVSFAKRLETIRAVADELPVAIIIHCIEDLSITYMNRPGLERIGTTLEELQNINHEQYFVRYFVDEDVKDYVPKILKIVQTGSPAEVSYFQKVRTVKEWQLFVSNTKVFARGKSGKVTHLITVASMLDPDNHITANVNRLMTEVNFLRDNSRLFKKLTKREKEILTLMARGMNSAEISQKLFISPTTADTHRRNIKSKLDLKSRYDIVQFAQVFNLI